MISICMATYNGEKFIRKQLECLYDQTVKPDEVIICDDCSCDKTVHIIHEFIHEYQLTDQWILYENSQNKGYPDNFYYSMSLAKGDIIFLADQDDVWSLDKIQIMKESLQNNPQINVLCCKMGLIDVNESKINTLIKPNFSKETGAVQEVSLHNVLYKNEWSGMVMAYRNAWYHKYMDQLNGSKCPHDLCVCALAATDNSMYQLDSVLAFHRRHDSNAGREEHRLSRLIDKATKMTEINNYITHLNDLEALSIITQEWAIEEIAYKRNRMQTRMDLLEQGKMLPIIKNYTQHKKDVRLFTLLCDIAICIRR